MTRLIIGLMSGTSVDAIDAALVEVKGSPKQSHRGGRSAAYRPPYRCRVIHHIEHPWPKDLRQRLLNVMAPAATTTQEICELNFLVARESAQATQGLLKSARVAKQRIAAIASHGQTICHLPPGRSQLGSTLQIGDPSVLATLTGIRTVGNFRPADMALGGQGAPLVPWTDAILLSHERRVRAVQNIGGIANVTYLPALREVLGGREARGRKLRNAVSGSVVLAFDTGPGNMAIDAAVSISTGGKSRYDKNGQLAAAGRFDVALFERLKRHPYFERVPPKSTGREEFGMSFVKSLLARKRTDTSSMKSVVHTLTRLTAWSIADAYRRFLPRMPDEVILCGGGADNPTLVERLREELGPRVALVRMDDFGIPNKAKEAASFALLGAATLDGVPANLPSVTGAGRQVVLGAVCDPGRV